MRGNGSNGKLPDPRGFSFRERFWLNSDTRAVQQAARGVRALARKCRCPEPHQIDLEIAVREAVANAIVHGNGEGSREKILMRCYADPRAGIVVAVRDRGVGFDPHAVPDPREADRKELGHGRGVFLMRELVDHVEYRRGGREVFLFKSWPSKR